MLIRELYEIYRQYPSVKTDSRKLEPGDIFFALKGDNFNGNAFAREAIEAGAVYAVIDDPAVEIAGKTILANDVLTTLQELATWHRRQLTIPFIGITGSNGKTTTKELVHAVLSRKYKTYTTEGNLNNHIGVPLTILQIKQDAEIAVIEMGANHIGEIASYCKMALPDHGIITNCGKAHLEGFGSEENVRKAKGELFDHVKTLKDGLAFVNRDYEYLREMSKGISRIITYGTTKEAQVAGNILRSDPLLEVEMIQGLNEKLIKTNLIGDYNLPNVLAAIATGTYFNIPDDAIKAAIEGYVPSNSRSQLVEKGTNKLIVDTYNANPTSMKLAIENFARLPATNKVLVLGSMAELGKQSIAEHRSIIDLVNNYSWKSVLLVGPGFLELSHHYIHLENATLAKQWLHDQHYENTWFLIKGSRSMEMEKVLDV